MAYLNKLQGHLKLYKTINKRTIRKNQFETIFK